ncbi:MAG: aminopeptidase N [Planctomycetota bacterium]|jgi:aminopeptidase N
MNLILPLLLVLAPAFQDEKPAPLTSGRPAPDGQTCFEVESYHLRIKVLPEKQSIEGSVDVTAQLLRPTKEIVLDLHDDLKVSRIALKLVDKNGLASHLDMKFTQKEGEVTAYVLQLFRRHQIVTGQNFTLTVWYGGKPRVAPRAPWDGGFQWDRTPSGAHWIATSNQMQGADLWWPCKDQPDDEPESISIDVTVPEGLICASNGKLLEVTTADGWSTFHWYVSTPINTYGVALNIAPYKTITQDYTSTAGDTFPITYWVLPENLEKGKILFEDLLLEIRWFETTYGPYPFRADKFGLVETPHLGMEHQSIIAYGNDYRGNPWGVDQGFDFLMHHEVSHEWWANLVTCRNWKDFWIHESFGTYAQSLYTEHLKGPEAYRQRMSEIRKGIRNLAPVAPRENMSTAEVYFGDTGGDIYNKGAWVLHTLRWLVGDEKFFLAQRRMAYPDPALENLTDGSACRFVDTEEIRAIAEKYTEQDLDWFFEVYLRQPALPILEHSVKGGELRLQWIVPGKLRFPVPVEVSVDGELQVIPMRNGKGEIAVRSDAKIVIDPNAWLLKVEEPKQESR